MVTFIDTQACAVIVTAHAHIATNTCPHHQWRQLQHSVSPCSWQAAVSPCWLFLLEKMNVHSTKTSHALTRAPFPHHPRPTPVLSPQWKFTFCLIARATQIEDRSPFPDLQRSLSPAENGDAVRSGVWVTRCKGRSPGKEALLVFCNLNDSMVGPDLRWSIASL